LRSFETDIQTAIYLKSRLEPHQIAVAASGLRTRTDIEKNQAAGIWNFLVGESLVKAQNPRAFLRSLQGQE
jgi:indole-3-glycerol phosphate synthase